MAFFSVGESFACSWSAMAFAISLWMAKTSARSRSYVCAQRCASFRASISCALTRTRLLTRCTLPSTKCATKLLRDFAQVARDSSFVLHHRSATDHFQVGDLGE